LICGLYLYSCILVNVLMDVNICYNNRIWSKEIDIGVKWWNRTTIEEADHCSIYPNHFMEDWMILANYLGQKIMWTWILT